MFRIMFCVTLQAKFLDFRLALRASLPRSLRTFIATDMDISSREKSADLVQNIFKKCIDLLVAYAEHIIRHAPTMPHLIWSACTAKMRICGKSCKHMTRKIDFRNDLYPLRRRVFHYILYILLGIPHALAIRDPVIGIVVSPYACAVSHGTD